MRKYLVFSLVLFVLVQTSVAEAKRPPRWVLLARKLVGEAHWKRDQAIKSLRATRNLDRKLLRAIDSEFHYYALDVVVALNKLDWVDKLLPRTVSDDDGFLTLALNALLTNKNKRKICKHYLRQINKEALFNKLSAATLVAMLDTLGRLGYRLRHKSFVRVLQHSYPEVRRAGLVYGRNMMQLHRNYRYLKAMISSYPTQPYQLRVQLLYLWSEVYEKTKMDPIATCRLDPDPTVRNVCSSIAQIAGQPVGVQ